MPEIPEMWVKIEGAKFRCVVTDSHVFLPTGFKDGMYESSGTDIKLKPFETAAQALQRVYPGCQVYVGNLLVNAPGNREWLG